MEETRGWQTTINPELTEFLAELDMFYLGSVSATGQPHVQYRGGSPGFLKVINEQTLGFVDFGGNRQYITLGNLSENPGSFILMDYANSRRVRLWGTTTVVENDSAVVERLRDPSYPGQAERASLFSLEAWDVNCQQHIHPRFLQRQIAHVIEKLRHRVEEFEAELADLRKSIAPVDNSPNQRST
ncbi:MAG: pyridoxamine 5'-phosphate oxidase family protein [Pirellulales bacterium]